jgi:excisionase family DNA binding protein
MDAPKPFTPYSLAERWECSPAFVYRLIAGGKLKPFRLGGKLIRISVDEVLRWENGQASPDTGPTTSENTGSIGTSTSSPRAGKKMGSAGVTALGKPRRKPRDLHFMRSHDSGNG